LKPNFDLDIITYACEVNGILVEYCLVFIEVLDELPKTAVELELESTWHGKPLIGEDYTDTAIEES
jgi:hypothetical protein